MSGLSCHFPFPISLLPFMGQFASKFWSYSSFCKRSSFSEVATDSPLLLEASVFYLKTPTPTLLPIVSSGENLSKEDKPSLSWLETTTGGRTSLNVLL